MPPETINEAVNKALFEELRRDPDVFVMGEDIGKRGGVFRATQGLIEEFGATRIIDTPLAESSIAGIAMGAAMSGMRPIAEIQFADFIWPAMNQIVGEAARVRYGTYGKLSVPMVVRTPYGGQVRGGLFHSQSVEAYFAHTPGLKVIAPSTPYDAKGLLKASIRDDDPVIVFNNRQLMGLRFDDHVPEDQYTVQIGKSEIKQEGDDITLIGIGFTTRVCMEAAEELEEQGYSVEVLDLLSLSPMDNDAILSSVQKTRKVVIVDEDYPRCSIAADISALVAEEAFDYLDAPPRRVNAPHASVPYSRPLEALYVPNKEKVVEAALEIID